MSKLDKDGDLPRYMAQEREDTVGDDVVEVSMVKEANNSLNQQGPLSTTSDGDSDFQDEDEIREFDTTQLYPQETTNQISESDAQSIVGGESIDYTNKRIFSFQLPFGGTFSSIKSNIYHRLPNFNSFSFFNKDADDEIKEDIRLRLSRQESINTINEANYFKKYKGRDDVRFRAVKHSLANKYNDFIPHMNSSKPLEEYESIYNELEGNIVILGGYRGSILRDSITHKRIWIPIKAGFNLRKINLLLGPSIDCEINAVKYIYPDGILKNIGPIDLCKALIKKLSTPKTNMQEFGYDWRLSGEFVANQLEDFLTKIYEETGKPSLVICHSMGGLITTRTLHKNPKLFRSIIYVGVPSECLNILGPIRHGESVLFLDKILTAEANFMMRSSFNFLPLSGKVFYNVKTNEPYILDLFDADTWVEYNLNPLVAKTRLLQKLTEMTGSSLATTLLDSSLSSLSSRLKSLRSLSPLSKSPKSDTALLDTKIDNTLVPDENGLSIPFDKAYEYLQLALASAKEFLEDLQYKPELEDQYPPMAIVYGNTVPSVRGCHVESEQDIRDGKYYNFFYGHGDGVVHQKWLMPERRGFEVFNPETGQGQIVGKFSTTCGHVNLMTDLRAMGKALRAVHDAEMIWKK